MTTNEFHELCVQWLQNAATEQFAGIVEASFAVLGRFQRDLAVEFEVAESTVSRWAKGTARPHPRIQKQVIKSLQRRAAKQLLPQAPRPEAGAAPRRAGSSTSPGFSAPVPYAAKGGN